MNILIISNIELDTRNASGNTYANWFSDWKDAKIGCIYCRDTFVQNNFCSHYYSVSPFNIVKNLLCPWRIGKYYQSTDLGNNKSNIDEREHKLINYGKNNKIRSLFYLINDLLYSSKLWINNKYKNFINEFSPDIIFYFAKADAFLLQNIKYIQAHTSAKVVAFFADDVYARFKDSRGLIYRIFEKRFKKIVSLADKNYGASQLMCLEYSNLFNITITPLYKGCDIQSYKNKINTPIRIVYAGNLFYGRDSTLACLARAISKINQTLIKYQLEIYTNTYITPELFNSLEIPGASHIYGARNYDEIKQIMQSSDIVLHVESFNPKNIRSVRLSFSTKISDCLQSGSMLMVIGPRNIASVEEAISIDGSLVISDLYLIYDNLQQLLCNPNSVTRNAKLTNSYAQKYFHIGTIRNQLRVDLEKLILQ